MGLSYRFSGLVVHFAVILKAPRAQTADYTAAGGA
jgi:hypothetical protein